MIERDSRWEKVYASSGPAAWDDLTELRVVVIHQGQVARSVIRLLSEDLEEFPELFGITLDKMVEKIDELLDELESDGSRTTRPSEEAD